MDVQKENLKKIFDEKYVLMIVSFIFGLIMVFTATADDDVTLLGRLGDHITDWWRYNLDTYYTWSSRLLINFIWFVVLKTGVVGKFIYCSLSMYVFLWALSILFNKRNDYRINLFIVALVFLFPFDALSTAGWVATTTSYFGPQVFALASLVSIKKVLYDEKIKKYEFLFYCICVIYGANAEQMNIVLFVLFSVAIIYLFIIKKNDFRIGILYGLIILNMVNMFLCPGNRARDIAETSTWFPTYGMLNVIDKADIGLSTTLKWMFASNNVLIIFVCIVMTVLVWRKYREPFFRAIAVIPMAATLSFGPLKECLSALFPYISYGANDIDYYGAFTVAASGTGIGMVQFGIFLVIAMCICAEVLLLNDSIEGLVTDSTLILAGVASRVMMGFSPTVYGSGSRTYTTLVICMIAVTVHLYASNISFIEDVNKEETYRYILWGIFLLGLLNLFFLVATAFR